MKKNIAIILFVVLLISEMLGLKLAFIPWFSAKNLFLYGSLVIVMVHHAVARNNNAAESIKTVHIIFILLIIYALFSWLLTDIRFPLAEYSDKYSRFAALKGFLIDHYLFFMVFYYSVSSVEEGISLAKSLLILTFITTVITVVDVYNIPDLGIIKQMEGVSAANRGRVHGPLGEPNQYAAFLALLIPGYIALSISNRGVSFYKRYFYAIAALLSFMALILTGSRGGVTGLLLGSLWCLVLFRKQINTRQLFAVGSKFIIAAALVISVILVKNSELIMGRLSTFSKDTDAVTASAGRLWIWEQGYNVMKDHPLSFLVGMGWDTFAGYVGIVSHNTYLNVLFDLGVIGLGAYLFLIGWIIYKVKATVGNIESHERVLLGGFLFGYLAMLVSLAFVNLYTPWYFVWAYVGVFLRIAMFKQKEIISHEDSVQPNVVPSQLMV